MKIICEDQKEYDAFVNAMRYLHDFDFQPYRVKGKGIDTELHPIINDLYHLYLGPDDFPDKKKFLTIKPKRKTK